MARFTPTDLTATYGAVSALNANFDDIATLFEKCLFRDGSGTNAMTSSLDMNHNALRNVGTGTSSSDGVNLGQIQNLITASVVGTFEGDIVGSRALLSAIATPIANQMALLTESGREGIFVFSTANHATSVTNDTQQGVYVAPSTDTTGASGAWVRKYVGPLQVSWFGAVADLTTDDYPAIQAAIDFIADENPGGEVHIPAGYYRMSQKLVLISKTTVSGTGWGQNPGIISGTVYPHPTNFFGSVLYYDAGVAGMELHPHTYEESATLVEANPSAYYLLPSAYGSIIQGIAFISADAGGTAGTAYGFRTRTRFTMKDCLIYGFTGNGLQIEASSTDNYGATYGLVYGNANFSHVENVAVIANGGHGLSCGGSDANGITFLNLDSRENGGWGINLYCFLANTFTGGGVEINNRLGGASATTTIGSIKTIGASAGHIFSMYIEPGRGEDTDVTDAVSFIGGLGASPDFHPTNSPGFAFQGGEATRKGVMGTNYLNAITVRCTIGRDPSLTGKCALSFGSSDDSGTMDNYKLVKDYQWVGLWSLNYASGPEVHEYVTSDHTASTLANGYALGLPNGHYMGSANTAPRHLPSAATAPATITGYRTGDVIFNSAPASGSPMGWMCGAAAWLPMPNLP